jgi:cytochrome c5
MKHQKLLLWAAAILIGTCLSGMMTVQAQPPVKTEAGLSATNSVDLKTNTPAKPVEIKRQLTGAELYSMHCNRCHPERYPTERTAAQWKTLMLHMQVRANLAAGQSKLILQYLQENSGR